VALLSRLFMLVAVAVLPAIAIQSYNEFEFRRSRQMEVQEQALGLAKLAAAQQQQIVGGIRHVLIALSELPAIKAKAAEKCSTYLSTIKRRYPAFLSFAAVDMNGQAFCSTNGKTANVADRGYFADATRTGEFTVGEFSIGRLTGSRLLPFALPFYDDDRMEGVVIATLSLDWLAEFIAQMGVPPGAALAIADRDGTYLARYPDSDRFAGRKMPGEEYLRMHHSGTTTAVDVDHVERIVGYFPLQADSGELLLTFGLDKAQAFQEIQRGTLRGILLIALSVSLALVLTWLGARRFINGPVAQLVDAANQWRLGDYSRRVHIQDKFSEITRVADAFNSMANALAQRERELYDAKEKAEEAAARITTIFESTTDCVLIVDTEWYITYLNERAKAQLAVGYDLIGMNLCEIFPD
jgi:HAMP domain-containing protein